MCYRARDGVKNEWLLNSVKNEQPVRRNMLCLVVVREQLRLNHQIYEGELLWGRGSQRKLWLDELDEVLKRGDDKLKEQRAVYKTAFGCCSCKYSL